MTDHPMSNREQAARKIFPWLKKPKGEQQPEPETPGDTEGHKAMNRLIRKAVRPE